MGWKGNSSLVSGSARPAVGGGGTERQETVWGESKEREHLC